MDKNRAYYSERKIHSKSITTDRKCLRCEKTFKSEGIHNRICNTCKLSSDWQFGDGGVTTSGAIPTRKGRSE